MDRTTRISFCIPYVYRLQCLDIIGLLEYDEERDTLGIRFTIPVRNIKEGRAIQLTGQDLFDLGCKLGANVHPIWD